MHAPIPCLCCSSPGANVFVDSARGGVIQCDTRGGVAPLSSTALLGWGPREVWADSRVNAGCSCLNVVVP